MASSDHYTALGPGQNGFFTDAARLAYGVNVQGTTAGVYAEALANSPGTRSSPDSTGICGWGDSIGVIGLGKTAGGQGDSGPQPVDARPTGVLGLAQEPLTSGPATVQVVGVHGDCGSATLGTGVHGTSEQGIGVWGSSTFNFGVFGQAQAVAGSVAAPYSTAFVSPGTAGVFGVGDNYGGVFQPTAPQTDPSLPGFSIQFGNVQLTPVDLGNNLRGSTAVAHVPPKTAPTPPDLPRQGQPGDVLVVNQNGIKDAQVWICLAPAPKSRPAGAVWARVTFDYVFATEPL